jgi:hypothetical protein
MQANEAVSGVQADSSIDPLVVGLLMAAELLFHPAAPVDLGRHWWAFDGPVTAQTAQRRPSKRP